MQPLFILIALAMAGLQQPVNPPSTPVNETQTYVALGDSFSAGYYGDVDETSSFCKRTSDAHPEQTGTALGFPTRNLACSGARVKAGILQQQVNNGRINPAQIDSLKTTTDPSLITISIGGNDVGWANFLNSCKTATCGTEADDTTLNTYSEAVTTNLKTAFGKIQAIYGDNTPPVIIFGYPTFIPTINDNCSSLTGFDQPEIDWLRNRMFTSVNKAVSDAASEFPFAHYVLIDNTTGHEVCSTDPWFYPGDSGGYFHPNSAGQKAISDKIVQTYNSL